MTDATDDEGGSGRPRLYADPETFEARTNEYFAQPDIIPTMAGLCVFLGFSDRDSFSRYETYGPAFSRTVKKARLLMEADRNERLMTKFTPGVIFDLKNNHGWKDKTEQEISGGIGITISSDDAGL